MEEFASRWLSSKNLSPPQLSKPLLKPVNKYIKIVANDNTRINAETRSRTQAGGTTKVSKIPDTLFFGFGGRICPVFGLQSPATLAFGFHLADH
jgi:hypothetical protein